MVEGSQPCGGDGLLELVFVLVSGLAGVLIGRFWQRKDQSSAQIMDGVQNACAAIDDITLDAISYFTVVEQNDIKRSKSALINYKFKKLRNELRILVASAKLDEQHFFHINTRFFDSVTKSPFGDALADYGDLDGNRIDLIQSAASDFLEALRQVKR